MTVLSRTALAGALRGLDPGTLRYPAAASWTRGQRLEFLTRHVLLATGKREPLDADTVGAAVDLLIRMLTTPGFEFACKFVTDGPLRVPAAEAS